MKIQEGKSYLTRDGRTAYVESLCAVERTPYKGIILSRGTDENTEVFWTRDGFVFREDLPDDADLVEEISANGEPAPEPTEQEEPMQALKLGDEYDKALMGATIRGEFVYSLSQLVRITAEQRVITQDVAHGIVAEQVVDITRQHGRNAPVFVDDTLFRKEVIELDLDGMGGTGYRPPESPILVPRSAAGPAGSPIVIPPSIDKK